jgi:Na+/melibiose symporter-like transporter
VFGLEALKASIYFNSIFSALADLFGNLLIQPVVKRFKRKRIFYLVFSLCLIFSSGFLIINVP